MRYLELDELRQVMGRHPELRMHQITMDEGLIVEGDILLIPTGEGELIGVSLEGWEEMIYEPESAARESYLQYLRGGTPFDAARSDDAASDILSSYGIAPIP